MATAKKAVKKARSKPANSSSTSTKEAAPANPPEATQPDLSLLVEQHEKEVKILAAEIIKTIQKTDFHPAVALHAMEGLVSAGIGVLMGENHQELYDAYISQFRKDSRLLSLLEIMNQAQGPQGEQTGI